MSILPPQQDDDVPPELPEERHPWWRMALVCLGIDAALLGVMFTGVVGERIVFVTYVLGLMAGLVSCFAAWAACGPGGVFTRVPGALFATIGIWFVFVAAMDQGMRDHQTPILTAILSLGHLGLVAGGLVLARQLAPGGFELEVEKESELLKPSPAPATESKFSILHMMGWMTAVAILCAIGSRVFADRLDDFLRGVRELLPICVITLTSAGIGTLQVMCVSRPNSRGAYLAMGALAVPFVSVIELALLLAVDDGPRPPGGEYWLEMGGILFFMNLIHTLVVWMTYGLMHAGGLRWVEPPRVPPSNELVS